MILFFQVNLVFSGIRMTSAVHMIPSMEFSFKFGFQIQTNGLNTLTKSMSSILDFLLLVSAKWYKESYLWNLLEMKSDKHYMKDTQTCSQWDQQAQVLETWHLRCWNQKSRLQALNMCVWNVEKLQPPNGTEDLVTNLMQIVTPHLQ